MLERLREQERVSKAELVQIYCSYRIVVMIKVNLTYGVVNTFKTCYVLTAVPGNQAIHRLKRSNIAIAHVFGNTCLTAYNRFQQVVLIIFSSNFMMTLHEDAVVD
jgi:hypothetical protein